MLVPRLVTADGTGDLRDAIGDRLRCAEISAENDGRFVAGEPGSMTNRIVQVALPVRRSVEDAVPADAVLVVFEGGPPVLVEVPQGTDGVEEDGRVVERLDPGQGHLER